MKASFHVQVMRNILLSLVLDLWVDMLLIYSQYWRSLQIKMFQNLSWMKRYTIKNMFFCVIFFKILFAHLKWNIEFFVIRLTWKRWKFFMQKMMVVLSLLVQLIRTSSHLCVMSLLIWKEHMVLKHRRQVPVFLSARKNVNVVFPLYFIMIVPNLKFTGFSGLATNLWTYLVS